MTHRRTIQCGREGIAVSIGSTLPHQVTTGDLSYGQTQRCQAWPEIPPTSAAAVHGLKSINEHDGDTVKGSREDAGDWW